MQNLIWFSWLVGTLALFAVQPRWGGMAYVVAALLAPFGVFSSGSLFIRIDLVLPPLMLAFQFLGISRTTTHVSLVPITWLFVLWLVWIGFTTVSSEQGIYLVGAYGYIRLVLVMTIFSWIPWRDQDVQEYQYAYVLTSIPIGVLAVGQIVNVPFLRALTEEWYSPPSAIVIELQTDAEQAGYLYRALGVFGNVSPAATYFLLTVCLTILLLSSAAMRARRSWLVLTLAASISGGLATLSSTFVGGILLAVFIAFIYSDSHHRSQLMAVTAGCLAILAIAVAVACSSVDSVDAILDYQWQRITSGEFLTGRYSIDDGVLAYAIEEFMDQPFTGIGWTLSDTFSGDSIYMSLLYCSGIIGCLPLAAGMVRLTLAAFRNKPFGHWALRWTAIMLLGGIGCTSLLSGRLADGWWAMQGMLISQLAAAPRRQAKALSRTKLPPVALIGGRPRQNLGHRTACPPTR